MNKPIVFISHITEEAAIVGILGKHIENDFLGLIDVFVSSDKASIKVGDKWLNRIDEALKTAAIELILCSEDSVKRPWINFEAGACWIKGIPVVPICHTGMRPADLPIPLNMLQAIEPKDESGIKQVYQLLANQLGSVVPKANFAEIVREVLEFENENGLIKIVRNAVMSLIKLLPEIAQIFYPHTGQKLLQGDVQIHIFDKMREHLELLRQKGFIDFSNFGKSLIADPRETIETTYLNVQIDNSYNEIAQQIIK